MSRPDVAHPRAARGSRGAHSSRRPAAPAVLLTSMALAFAGLALSGTAGPLEVPSVGALTVSSAQTAPAPGTSPVDIIYGIGQEPSARAVPVARPTTRPSEPSRASRSRSNPTPGSLTSSSARWARPVGGRLTSRFGWRWGRAHKGVDIGATYGVPVRAVGTGTVISAGWSGGYGKLVTVRHRDGTVTAYAHMSDITVFSGRVVAGQQIGRIGSTGRSTGPHLHFEVRTSGGILNPLKWLIKRGISV